MDFDQPSFKPPNKQDQRTRDKTEPASDCNVFIEPKPEKKPKLSKVFYRKFLSNSFLLYYINRIITVHNLNTLELSMLSIPNFLFHFFVFQQSIFAYAHSPVCPFSGPKFCCDLNLVSESDRLVIMIITVHCT